jgi:hypothetical protein
MGRRCLRSAMDAAIEAEMRNRIKAFVIRRAVAQRGVGSCWY